MTVEKLFEMIRGEEVCLCIGAGFSRYAGYPTGLELKRLIEQSLDELEKKSYPLSIICGILPNIILY